MSFKTISRSIAMSKAPGLSPFCRFTSVLQNTHHLRPDKKQKFFTCICAADEAKHEIDGHHAEDGSGWSKRIGNRILTGRISQTALVALRTCAYISTVGAVALFFPDLIIRICNFMSKNTASLAVDSFLVRIGGCLAMLFGAYYCGAALDDMQGNQPRCFYISTVLGRYFLGIVFACLYASTGLKYAWVLALGVINVFSGFQMQRALMVCHGRRNSSPH